MKLNLTERQKKLYEFVKEQHKGQKRKYTDLDYITHIENVTYTVSMIEPKGIEPALCHDLLEDTECTIKQLQSKLLGFGYSDEESGQISFHVLELTNTYTSSNLPNVKREIRKEKECLRLSNISPLSQTVKYCDIIDNGKDIYNHDKKFGKLYLKEAAAILSEMDKGNEFLYKACCNIIQEEHLKIVNVNSLNEEIVNHKYKVGDKVWVNPIDAAPRVGVIDSFTSIEPYLPIVAFEYCGFELKNKFTLDRIELFDETKHNLKN